MQLVVLKPYRKMVLEFTHKQLLLGHLALEETTEINDKVFISLGYEKKWINIVNPVQFVKYQNLCPTFGFL